MLQLSLKFRGTLCWRLLFQRQEVVCLFTQWVEKNRIGGVLLCPLVDELREELVETYVSRRVPQRLGLIKIENT